jgi:prevent-host-death family protein
MGQYNIQEAKTRLSELLHMVERGEEVVIAKAGKPIARIVRIEHTRKRE